MAKGVNKVILIGNLGADPEMRYMPNGTAVANLRLATSDSWKDKSTGEQVERTEWHRVVLFQRLGEIAGEYLKKGSKVYIEGRIQTRKWQDKEGHDHYTTEIVGSDLQMLDSRSSGSASYNQGGGNANVHPNASSNTGANTGGNTGNSQNDVPFDDDIPF